MCKQIPLFWVFFFFYLLSTIIIHNLGRQAEFPSYIEENLDKLILFDRCIFCEFV